MMQSSPAEDKTGGVHELLLHRQRDLDLGCTKKDTLDLALWMVGVGVVANTAEDCCCYTGIRNITALGS